MAHIKPLNSILQKIANEELFEVPTRISEDLEALKLWIGQQPHLKSRTDDQFLIQFLRGCKYSLERAKEKIDRYYTLKTKFPHIMGIYDVDNERFRQITRLGCIAPLPIPLNDTGCRLVMNHFNYNPEECTAEEMAHVGIAIYELFTIDDPYAGICGIVTIIDMSKVTMAHVLQANPIFLKTMVTFFEKSLPLRIKAIYFVNIPKIASSFFKLLLPLFSEKLRQRIFLYPTLEELKKYIPLKYLPEYYGGENGSMEDHIRALESKFDEYRQFFKENANYGTDESLRQGGSANIDELFGVGGAFRKLEVD
ncbi:alpha-tocopherol transfer protein-like [Musca vetustissima]|uniref:alpha-tocopherol transfer protein-like n=1 Tax=Musca vetustissima TaxID=27455 RepID=UPI002AB6D60E|nr:alpha-tocopherol transfer protein-like [Musca vetustissima]